MTTIIQEDENMNRLVNETMEFFHNHGFISENREEEQALILNIYIFFGRYNLNKEFLTKYMKLYLDKIRPGFIITNTLSELENNKIHYGFFIIVYLIIITKYWVDIVKNNSFYSKCFEQDLENINQLELLILFNIDWNLGLGVEL
jgi:hypothetical protein